MRDDLDGDMMDRQTPVAIVDRVGTLSLVSVELKKMPGGKFDS